MAKKLSLTLDWAEPAPFRSLQARRNPVELLEAIRNPSYVPKDSPFYELAGRHGLYVIFLNDGHMEYPDGDSIIVYIGMSGTGGGGVGSRLHAHASRRGSLDLHQLLLMSEEQAAGMSFVWAPIGGATHEAREVATACAEEALLSQFGERYGVFPEANRIAGSCFLPTHYELKHRPHDPIESGHVD